MKTIGLIGGMSWESSIVYYELINKKVKELLGGFHSCQSLMYTVDFDSIVKLQHEGKWKELDLLMANSAKRLEKGGADIVVLCTNTMHLCSEAIKESISIPFLHIAEATGISITNSNIKKVCLSASLFQPDQIPVQPGLIVQKLKPKRAASISQNSHLLPCP